MTPQDFITKWRNTELKERSASQSHFNNLCRLLELDGPTTADGNPADLVDRVPEVVPGYPDRILPKDEEAAKELKKRTLTNLYDARPAWLDHSHKALEEAVADAHGWGNDWRAGALTEDEIPARLFKLNQERAKKEKS